MTTAMERSRQVAGAPADVWAQLTDWESAASWMGVDDVSIDGPTAQGAVLAFTARGKPRSSVLAEVEEPTRLVLRSTQGSVTADYAYVVRSIGDDRSEVTLRVDVDVRGPMRLLAPVIRAAMRREDGDQLDRFAATLST